MFSKNFLSKSKYQFLLLLLIIPLVVSCTGNPTTPVVNQTVPNAEADDPTTITFGIADVDAATYAPLIDAFHQVQTTVQVEVVSLDPLFDQATNDDEALAQILSTVDTALLPTNWVQRLPDSPTYLTDLRPLLDADPSFHPDDLYPGALWGFTPDQVSGLSREIAIPLLFYHPEVWEQTGLTPPTAESSWDEVLLTAQAFVDADPSAEHRYGLVGTHGTMALGTAFEQADLPLTDTSDAPTWPPDTALDALAQTVEWAETGVVYVPPFIDDADMPSVSTLIADGQVGLWSLAMGYTVDTTDREVAIIPSPTPHGTSSTVASSYVMSRGTQQPQATWRWLAFLHQQPLPQTLLTGLDRATVLPARPSIAEHMQYWETLETQTGIPDAAAAVTLALERLPTYDYLTEQTLVTLQQGLHDILYAEQPLIEVVEQVTITRDTRQALLTQASDPDTAAGVVVPPPDEPTDDQVTIITYGIPDFGYSTLPEVVRQFNETQDTLNVELWSAPTNTSIADLAARTDCFAWNGLFAPELYTSTMDLQPLIDADATVRQDDYPDLILLPFQHEGRLIGLPDQILIRTLEYNQELFDQAGLDYPRGDWTLNEFLAAAEQLTFGEEQDRHYGFVLYGQQTKELLFFLDRFEVEIVQQQPDGYPLPQFIDPQVLAGTQFYVDLLRNHTPNQQLRGYTDSEFDPEVFNVLREQRAGMWFISNRFDTGEAQGQGFAGATAPPPLGSSQLTMNDIHRITGLYISADTEHPAACWEWIKVLREIPARFSIHSSLPAQMALDPAEDFLQGAPPGTAEVYAAYQEVLSRTSVSEVNLALQDPDLDLFWFYQAVDRAVQGGNLEQELTTAQQLTEAHLACVATGGTSHECAAAVDPEYAGWQLYLLEEAADEEDEEDEEE
ncbi:MAG: hypothetical protein GFH27_549279n212 [Chloroflexi bacterium AL-W]|nr:hypothetical protein [Chloroflexi bacterium AL-N1]NOK65178.1 hypothetical protein [Chloroflexi bacterium AL-N10]NOK72556.1 hypothetical protein [Chloroflexi bacterium AL-N5]NOK79357.1 hypothetical protein [Chloroflexi bacterium AL-W]NOK87273.1 hypothetical protein [Chloroflexi bacterium AL-N15]